jgi:hypothetical protein
MGNLWVLLAAPAAFIAAWLFLMVYGEQKADLQATKQEQRRDRAEFDRDFDRAWNGKAASGLTARASDAAAEFEVAEVARKKAEAARVVEQAQQEREMRELLQLRVGGESEGKK